MYPSERKTQENIASLAAHSFKDHIMTTRLGQGLFRNWQCARPGSSFYLFNVSTEPGRLFVTGDIGDMIFARESDMISWLRRCIGDPHYVAGKVQGRRPREWSEDVVRDWLAERAKEEGADRKKLAKLGRTLDDGRPYFDIALHESGIINSADWPDFTAFTTEFLWIMEALKWFLLALDGQQAVTA
jgi:hypothetical protein